LAAGQFSNQKEEKSAPRVQKPRQPLLVVGARKRNIPPNVSGQANTTKEIFLGFVTSHFFLCLMVILIIKRKQKMKKLVLSVALLATSIMAIAQNKTTTEVAIYRISPVENLNFDKLYGQFRQEVSKLKGYQTWLTLQDVHSPNIYIDILNWENLSLALAASDSVKNGEIYKPFTSAIDSLIHYGEFYSFKSFINKKSKINMDNKVTEVVIYQLKADMVSGYSNIADNTDNFLKNQKGFISRKILQDHKDKTIFMAIVEWETLADAETAMQKSQQESTLLPFFEATEKVITFSHYTFYK
jgi:methyltransferase-like protein